MNISSTEVQPQLFQDCSQLLGDGPIAVLIKKGEMYHVLGDVQLLGCDGEGNNVLDVFHLLGEEGTVFHLLGGEGTIPILVQDLEGNCELLFDVPLRAADLTVAISVILGQGFLELGKSISVSL